MRRIVRAAATSALLTLTIIACRRETPPDATAEASGNRRSGTRLTVYCSVDEGFARPILNGYQQRTGVKISAVFDTEAGKTTGLVNRILAEGQAGRPRADLFWSGELFHTILLARRDLLEAYDSPAAADIPERFKDPQHRWTGLAVRARVLTFDPGRTPPEQVPQVWHDLARPEHASRLAMANPLFGTTHGHVAAMFALWGPDRARSFLTELRRNGVFITDGNSAAVRAVIAGRVELAATDDDDVRVARRTGASLDFVYPDLGGGGALLIPCSVAILRGTRELSSAQKLADYLISPEVERALARSDSGNVPVRAALREELRMDWPPETVVDYRAVADRMEEAASAVREILIR